MSFIFGNGQEKYFQQKVREDIREKSIEALYNIYDYVSWRVEQLEHQIVLLGYIMSEPLELEDMFRLAERSERSMKNRGRFERLKEAIEYELIRRKFESTQGLFH